MWVLFRSFDELAAGERSPGSDQGDQFGCVDRPLPELTARHRICADSISLNTITSPSAHEPGPLVAFPAPAIVLPCEHAGADG